MSRPNRLARLRLLELEDRALPAPLLHVHDSSGRLFTVDVPTGDVQLIGSMGTVMFDIAFDGSGKLFGVDGGSTLYTIDVNTAATTEIGNLGGTVNSLVFSHGGELFAAGSNLYRVDTGTGAATNIGDLGSFNSAGDLAFDGDGNLFLSTTSNDLVRVDTATGLSTLVGAMGFSTVLGLAFGPDRVMYGLTNNTRQVFSIDLNTGAGTFISTYSATVGGANGSTFIGDAVTEDQEPNEDCDQATPFVRPKDRLTGSLENLNDRDFYSVTLFQGETIHVTPLTGADWSQDHGTPFFTPRIQIRNPNCTPVSVSEDGHGLDYTIPADGTYSIGLTSDSLLGIFTGSYSIEVVIDPFDGVSEAEHNETTATATDLGGSKTLRGDIANASDVDDFAFDVKAGQAVIVKFANLTAKNPSVRLLGPGGGTVATDRNGIGFDAVASTTGRCVVSFSSDGETGTITGQYVAHVVIVDKPKSEMDAADGFENAAEWQVGLSVVPSAFLGTSSTFAIDGLVGSYVDQGLWWVPEHADWRSTQTIAGTRTDKAINFHTNGWGSRAPLNLTGGTDADWELYSVQWDGFVSIPKSGTRLYTSTDDGSRMWIDVNRDGVFSAGSSEYVNNNWGGGQGTTAGPASPALAAGVYKVRIQYYEGNGGNEAFLLWDDSSRTIGTLGNTNTHAVGTLTSLNDVDVFEVELSATEFFRFRLDGTPGALAIQNRVVSLYNEYGQFLEYSTDGVVATDRYMLSTDRTGKFFVTVQALHETGLGGYALLSEHTASFPSQRDVPLYYHDYSDYSRQEHVPLMLGSFESRYDSFGIVDTTLSDPGSTERVSWKLNDVDGNGTGGVGGGYWGTRRPQGDSNGNHDGPRSNLAEIWMLLMYHEAGHGTGLPHTRHPLSLMAYGGQTDTFPPGSYYRMHGDPFVSNPKLQNERAYLDWVLFAGRITAEFERNDSLVTGQKLDPLFAEMTGDADDRNDAVMIAGQIGSTPDKDYYRFTAEAGQTFSFDIEAAEYQIPLDARLDLFDSQGNLLATSKNAIDRNSGIESVDPFLIHTFGTAGTYSIRVTSEFNTTGAYRLKVTPDRAFDRTGPRVISTWPDGSASLDSTRQLLFWFNHQLDPVSLTPANIVVSGSSTGVHSGQASFDPLNSMLVWTADQPLPVDTYTITLKSGANGIRDFNGNELDGETDGALNWPEIGGDGNPGGNFVTAFDITADDPVVAEPYYSAYYRHPHNRGQFNIWFTDELDIADLKEKGLTLRGAGADRLLDTADDSVQPLDVLADPKYHAIHHFIDAYTRGIPEPGHYRIEGNFLDAAGNPVVVAREIDVASPVASNALATTTDFSTSGLTGSYVNESLRSYATQDDWRDTQAIVGTRVDPEVRFKNGGWGNRDLTGITGGTANDWENFSAQWDGFIRITSPGTRLFTTSDDGSRLWIDLNNDGAFDETGDEFLDNYWGYEHGSIQSPGTVPLDPGVYRVRMQYEEAVGGNEMYLMWDDPNARDISKEGYGHGPMVAGLNLDANAVRTNGLSSIDVTFNGDIDPMTLTPDNFVVLYSQNPGFFDGNDVILTERDGQIAWDAVNRRASFEPATTFKNGHYLIELAGTPGGIADSNGYLLDGENLDPLVAGNNSPWLDFGSPSGDGRPGGTYRAYFNLNTIGVVSSVRADANPTAVETVHFVVTFASNVTGVDATDFALASSGLTGASIVSVSGSGKVYTVTVKTGTGEGPLRLDLIDNDSILDINGTPLGGVGAGNGSFFAGETYTIDRTITVREDERNPKGLKVETLLLASAVTDADPSAKRGMAIVGFAGVGRWEYSTNGGMSWRTLNGVSESAARLLRPKDKVRFVPGPDYTGHASFTFHAWDQTAGKAGSTLDLIQTGGPSSVSALTRTPAARIIPVNDAPLLDVGGEPRFTQVAPNDDNPLGDLARNVLGTAAVDVDGDAVGIAVMSMSGGGTWQFQRNNSPLWENVGSVSSKAARLIGALDRIRFLPDDNFAGVATLKFRASDGSAGTAGSLLKPKGTAFSKNIETGLLLVSSGPLPPVNNAPVLDDAGSPVLAAVAEELKSPPGNAVSSLLGTSFTDADGTQKGIAIVGLTQTNRGTWQYSTNNGKKWLNIGNVSIANALLLRESDHIRFVPGKDFNGLAEITYHAWDRSRGTAGSRANLAVPNGTGSSSAFSLEDETARVNVTPVNDAPVLITKPTPRLTPISPNVLFPAGDPVSSILGTAASDVEGNPLGIAVIGATGSGTWEYFTVASGIWDALGLVTPMNARLLDSSDLVRFRPDAAFTGTAKLFFKAWDHSEGVTDTLQSTAFSKATESATLIVNSIEERPLLDSRSTPTLSPVSVNDNDPPGNLVSALLGSWAFDADPGSQLGIAIIDATTVGGTWQYSSDGLTWDNLDTVSTTSPKRLLGIDRIRFKPNPGFSGTASLKYKAWDANSSDPLGPLALSTARETATVSVNSSPVL